MSYADIAKRREVRLAADRKRTGSKPWRPGGPGRPPKGATVEPQCNVSGKLRAEHVYDEDGLCDCGVRKMVFAQRPELRREILRKPPAPKPAKVAATAPPVVWPPLPKPLPPPPPRRPEERRSASPSQPEERIGGTALAAVIADFERRRVEIDEALEAFRKIALWWPRP